MDTLYAKYADTLDPVLNSYTSLKNHRNPYHKDVKIMNQDNDVLMIIPWYWGSKPTKRNKYIMYNCSKHKLTWR